MAQNLFIFGTWEVGFPRKKKKKKEEEHAAKQQAPGSLGCPDHNDSMIT